MADLLTLIGIPDGLSIAGGQFEVKRAVQRSVVPARYTPSEWSVNLTLLDYVRVADKTSGM
jgi:hypothetical protein